MRGVHLFMLVVAIPAIVALGHDIYLFTINYGFESLPNSILANEKGAGTHFATLGFIWTEYNPESYKMVVKSVSSGTWAIIDLFLTQKAFVVGVFFAAFFYFVLAVLRGLKLWPFADARKKVHSSGRGRDMGFKKGQSSTPVKYKKK